MQVSLSATKGNKRKKKDNKGNKRQQKTTKDNKRKQKEIKGNKRTIRDKCQCIVLKKLYPVNVQAVKLIV
jgi:hypothetical protein